MCVCVCVCVCVGCHALIIKPDLGRSLKLSHSEADTRTLRSPLARLKSFEKKNPSSQSGVGQSVALCVLGLLTERTAVLILAFSAHPMSFIFIPHPFETVALFYSLHG